MLAIIGFLVYSILKYRKSSQALVKANDTIIDSQRELEAYAKDLKTSQKALNSKSDALKQQEEKIEQLVDYDQMTGYMNTHKFISHVNEQMNYWNRLHLIYLTISNISDVSNTLGFGVYETLLHQISQKVRLILDPEHYDIGIIKGDDIVILSNNSSTDIEKDMSQIVTMFESPLLYRLLHLQVIC